MQQEGCFEGCGCLPPGGPPFASCASNKFFTAAAMMTFGHFYSVVFGVASVVVGVVVCYGQNSQKGVVEIVPPANSTSQLQHSLNDTVKTLVDKFKRDKNWSALKNGLKHELNSSSTAYREVDSIGDDVQYPLELISSSVSYMNLLSILLDGGLTPDAVAGPDNWTMLHFSAEHGTTSVAGLLLRHEADPDVRTSTQDTPIIIAAWRNHLPIVKLLKENGADLNSQNEDGRTALHRAAYWGNTDVVRYLVDSGANKTVTTKLGNTPLDDARDRGYTAIIELLS